MPRVPVGTAQCLQQYPIPTGAGPIGCLVAAALAALGAESVLVSDLVDEALAIATAVGAAAVVRADRPDDPNWPEQVDVAIEASGSAAGLASCARYVRRGGTIVQLGLLPPGNTPFAGNVLVTREITLVGAFRFDTEFGEALSLLAGRLHVDPIITQIYPLTSVIEAFELAGDRRRACKVLLDFNES